MNKVEALVDRLLTQRWSLHIIFWLSIVVVYVFFLGKQSNNYFQTFILVLLLIPVTMGTSYFLNYRLIPDYLMKERFAKFLLYFIYVVLASIFIEMLLIIMLFIVLADFRIKNMNPASTDIFFLLSALLMVVFLAGGIKILGYWRQSRDRYQALMKEKIEAELRFLKTQLNPHFLFNTLNNLYYLSSQKSDRTPHAILALSEILDYILQAGKISFIPLSKELKQVQNYIDLELLRYEERVTTSIVVEGVVEKCELPPMILLTLLENAFKHGVMPVAGKSWINVFVKSDDQHLMIVVKNSCRTRQPDRGKGIGIENLRNQLKLLYAAKFSLQIIDDVENEFSIALTIIKIP